ncbi:MAG TPA: hypothetical protein VMR62_21775 [Bryobacteraceae bacterium]|jgi:hypothetical protein|nr:hypothetical protein [Bryobacteraceae bacterium]
MHKIALSSLSPLGRLQCSVNSHRLDDFQNLHRHNLVRAQFQAKQEGALEWRIRRANLPERWTLEKLEIS